MTFTGELFIAQFALSAIVSITANDVYLVPGIAAIGRTRPRAWNKLRFSACVVWVRRMQ